MRNSARQKKNLEEKIVNSFENSFLFEGITPSLGEISIFLEKISVIFVYRSDFSNCQVEFFESSLKHGFNEFLIKFLPAFYSASLPSSFSFYWTPFRSCPAFLFPSRSSTARIFKNKYKFNKNRHKSVASWMVDSAILKKYETINGWNDYLFSNISSSFSNRMKVLYILEVIALQVFFIPGIWIVKAKNIALSWVQMICEKIR